MPRTVCIVAARMSSTRLPGKVLMDIAGKPMLQRVVERARRIEGIDSVVVATSFSEADQAIVRYCQMNGIGVYRGGVDENDVLWRYHDVAALLSAEVVVRITADCPLLCPVEAGTVLALFRAGEYDYCSNVDPRVVPDGYDTEVFSREALDRAWLAANGQADREHVTSTFRKNPKRFRLGSVEGDTALASIKVSVDTEEDLDLVRRIYADLGDGCTMADVVKWWKGRQDAE